MLAAGHSGREHDAGALIHHCPLLPEQDVLAVGHSGGVSTMLVPGAGEPNYDSRVADPFQGRAAAREAEVHALLDKLQPDMIRLDPSTIAQARSLPSFLHLTPWLCYSLQRHWSLLGCTR